MTELALQTFAATLLRLNAMPGVIYFHVPNGEYRSPRTGARLKAMGVLPGVADITVVLPGGSVAFLELKVKGGSLNPNQRAFRTLCESNGTPYAVARTPEEVTATLRGWGALKSNVHFGEVPFQ